MVSNVTLSVDSDTKLEIDKEKGRDPKKMYKAYLEALQNKKK